MIIALASIAAKIGFGLLGFAKKQASEQTERLRIERGFDEAQVKASVDLAKTLATTGTDRQKAKMNSPVFWFIIVAALGPGVLNMWSLWLFNIFWWENGIWPQTWAIAAYPPQAAVWVNLSIEWLFDPVGLAVSVGTATGAGLATGRRR